MKLFASRPAIDRKGELQAFAVALLGHIVVIALLVVLSSNSLPALDEGEGALGFPRAAGGGGGGGGEETIQYISLVEAAPEPAPVEPAVVPEKEVPVIPPPVVPPIALAPSDTVTPETGKSAVADTAIGTAVATSGSGAGSGTGIGPGTGSGTGGGNGSGTGTGDGSGSGPGSGGGDGIGGRSPMPRMVLLPPPAPASFRGKSVTVQLTVDSEGIVRDVRLRPPTGDGKFDAALRRDAREWRFRPGTDASGRAVTKLFEVVFSF